MRHQLTLEFEFPEDENHNQVLELNLSTLGPLHMVFNQFINFTSRYQQPIVKPAKSALPDKISALYRIANKYDKYALTCPHFFTKDENIEPAWTRPLSYLAKLQKFGRCMSPDFSIFENMVNEQKKWNSFRNKFLTALWQHFGIDVIAAPSCGDIADIDYYMEGWPKHSLIAINSTGVGTNKHSQYLFLDGYFAMLDILKPTHILRYGACIEGERTDISTYYPNDFRKEVKHGCE